MISPVIPMGDPVRSSACTGSETVNAPGAIIARSLYFQIIIVEFSSLLFMWQLLERLDPLCLADDIAETHAELVVDHDHFTARHQRTVHEYIERLSGQCGLERLFVDR